MSASAHITALMFLNLISVNAGTVTISWSAAYAAAKALAGGRKIGENVSTKLKVL
jgi:hypothetical protein